MSCNKPLKPAFRRGDLVRVKLNTCYRHFLDGLEGKITQVLHHAVIVALDSDPMFQQKIVGPSTDPLKASVGPIVPNQAQRMFQFHEIEKVTP